MNKFSQRRCESMATVDNECKLMGRAENTSRRWLWIEADINIEERRLSYLNQKL